MDGPTHESATTSGESGENGVNGASVRALTALLSDRRIAVLTGAGVSTASGIPDYRSPGRPRRTPIQHRQFVVDQ